MQIGVDVVDARDTLPMLRFAADPLFSSNDSACLLQWDTSISLLHSCDCEFGSIADDLSLH